MAIFDLQPNVRTGEINIQLKANKTNIKTAVIELEREHKYTKRRLRVLKG